MENSTNSSYLKIKHLIVLLVVAGLIAMGIISLIRERIVNPYRYQISFTAEGTAFIKPDIAQITLGVKTERQPKAVDAVKENTKMMNEIISVIKEQGVEEKDIKTTSYNLNPAYDYEPQSGRSVLRGYEIYQNVTVKIRDLDKIGAIIEASTGAGANQVGNINFT
ncbi:MAG: hypothetical protein COU22_01965, partial [Candidatus Komeilibacteria bacterium CG10_big_fil_rev_8_21_14_0_10_41_13]